MAQVVVAAAACSLTQVRPIGIDDMCDCIGGMVSGLIVMLVACHSQAFKNNNSEDCFYSPAFDHRTHNVNAISIFFLKGEQSKMCICMNRNGKLYLKVTIMWIMYAKVTVMWIMYTKVTVMWIMYSKVTVNWIIYVLKGNCHVDYVLKGNCQLDYICTQR